MRTRLPAPALLAAALLLAAPFPRAAVAQVLQSGDIVVPGTLGGQGTLFRVRGATVTALWTSSDYDYPSDLMVDSQGRLVFLASPRSRNGNDVALFRIDPATGALERLFYFPYIVAAGDTLPHGVEGASGFYGHGQSLHLETSYGVTIDDHVNGGWPQVYADESYGFSIGTTIAGQSPSTAYRCDPARGICETGVSLAPLQSTGAALMASDGTSIYYSNGSRVGRAEPDLELNLHLTVGGTTIDAQGRVSAFDKLLYDNPILDNTTIPNVSVTCGKVTDTDVPMVNGGFTVLSLNGIGVLGGALYGTSNSVASGVPYLFSIAGRAPFLNPYICTYYNAVTMNGPVPFWLTDGTATTPWYTSPDGGALLATCSGTGLAEVGTDGSFTKIDASQSYSGRPVRWTGGASGAPRAAALATAADSTPVALVVRADSLVDVMVTDAQGRRLGFAADGSPVNDFGAAGQTLTLGPSGWPRIAVLMDPAPGNFYCDVAGAGDGAYGVSAYLAQATSGGMRADITGTAQSGLVEHRALQVTGPTTLAWYPGELAVGPAGSGAPGFVTAGPVPARGAVRFSYRVPAGGARVRLDVYDLAGRRVATLADGGEPGGITSRAWDGDDAAGRRVAPGLYLARLAWQGHVETRHVVIVP